MKKLAITIFFDAFALMLLGLIIVMSASSTYSVIRFDSVFHLFNSHLFKVGIAFFLMILFSMIPYEIYKSYCKPAMIGITLVLIITLIIAILIWLIDYIIPAMGTKKFGGSKAGVFGTIVGLLVAINKKRFTSVNLLKNYR